MTVIVQIAALSIAALIDFMRNTPKTSEESDALDKAAMELILQTSYLADAVRERLCAPDIPPAPPCPPDGLPPE